LKPHKGREIIHMTAVDRAANAAATAIRNGAVFVNAVGEASRSEGVDFAQVCHELNRRATIHRRALKRRAQKEASHVSMPTVSEPAVAYWWDK
jgi:uncharacterized protein YwlG (UPF0340 family)